MVNKKNFLSTKVILDRISFQLNTLETELKKIQEMENKIEALIQLFRVVSPIQDAGGFETDIRVLKSRSGYKKDYRCEVEILETLQVCFHTAGRSPYGMNRTNKGEIVSPDRVYLGDVFGMHSHPATYWLNNRRNLEESFRADISKDPDNPLSQWQIIHDHQCGVFVDEHLKTMLKHIALFQKEREKRK